MIGAAVRDPERASSPLPLAAILSPVSVTWPGPGYGNKAFTGREWDPESGLFYYRARYYDPKAGRFISEDPIGFGGGTNTYAYVKNDPINVVDPLGLAGLRVDPNTPIGRRMAEGDMGALEKLLFPLDFILPLSVVEKAAAKGAAELAKHHVFPQRFREVFEAAGIDIDKFLVKIPREWHQRWVHAFGQRGGQWNAAWEKFLGEHPGASADEMWEFLEQLIETVGFCPR